MTRFWIHKEHHCEAKEWYENLKHTNNMDPPFNQARVTATLSSDVMITAKELYATWQAAHLAALRSVMKGSSMKGNRHLVYKNCITAKINTKANNYNPKETHTVTICCPDRLLYISRSKYSRWNWSNKWDCVQHLMLSVGGTVILHTNTPTHQYIHPSIQLSTHIYEHLSSFHSPSPLYPTIILPSIHPHICSCVHPYTSQVLSAWETDEKFTYIEELWFTIRNIYRKFKKKKK